MRPFEDLTYLGQFRRLRRFAKIALAHYPIQVRSTAFIHHGENATFRILAKNGAQFLLRIHRDGYHTQEAIEEELKWLTSLSRDKTALAPKPIRSKKGSWVERVSDPATGLSRNCCVFVWIDGKFIRKSLRIDPVRKLGCLLGRLQGNPPPEPLRHRKYWHAEGLLGKNAKFGPIDSLAGASVQDQKIITDSRRSLLRKLQAFERKYPYKLGMIHADLHFGNLISNRGDLGAIDFDDSGHGFHAYDLAVSLLAIEGLLGPKNKRLLPSFKNALLEGYSAEMPWDAEDEAILPDLMKARRLVMLGWLNSRSDNPRLKKYLRGAIKRAVKKVSERKTR